MEITITYEEVSNIIKTKSNVNATFTMIDSESISVKVKPALLIPAVNITLKLEKDAKEYKIRYGSGVVSRVTKIVNLFVNDKLPEFVRLDTSNNILSFDSTIKHNGIVVDIKDITFLEEKISISLFLKDL
jgi:hypothetical protein